LSELLPERGVEVPMGDSPKAVLTTTGYAAILAALSLNIFFVAELPRHGPLRHSGSGLANLLLIVAPILVWGLFWFPAKASLQGQVIRSSLENCLGSQVARAIATWLLPAALCGWFFSIFISISSLLPPIFTAEPTRDLWPRALVILLLLTLASLSLWDSAANLGRSAVFLVTIGFLSFSTQVYALWDLIPEGGLFLNLARIPELGWLPTTNFILHWFAPPLFFLAASLRPSDRDSLRLATATLLGLVCPFVLAVLLATYLYAAADALFPQTFGTSIGVFFRHSEEFNRAKLMVVLLSSLVLLRLPAFAAMRSAGAPLRKRLIIALVAVGTGLWCFFDPESLWLTWIPSVCSLTTIPLLALAGALAGGGLASFLLEPRQPPVFPATYNRALALLVLTTSFLVLLAALLDLDVRSFNAAITQQNLVDVLHGLLSAVPTFAERQERQYFLNSSWAIKLAAALWAANFLGSFVLTLPAAWPRRRDGC